MICYSIFKNIEKPGAILPKSLSFRQTLLNETRETLSFFKLDCLSSLVNALESSKPFFSFVRILSNNLFKHYETFWARSNN